MYSMSAPTVAGFATLPPREASEVVAQHPELAAACTSATPVVVAVSACDAVEAAQLRDLLTIVTAHLGRDRASLARVLRALLPPAHFTVSPPVLEQVQRNAEAHAELAGEFGLLSSAEVAKLAGSTASNRAATANRWANQRKVFTVEVDGAQRFPGFQFGENGRPLPVIADVLTAAGDRLSGWELALWFTGSSAWLGGERPVDVIDSDPEMVVEAVRQVAEELLG